MRQEPDIENGGYPFAPLAYHDTWLSIDPIIGCSYDCKYCYLQIPGWTAQSPRVLHSVDRIVEMLLGHRLFRAHQTPLCFGNQTDAFLNANVEYVAKLVQQLEAQKLQNPLVFITKSHIPDSFISSLQSLQSLRVVFFLSYSGLPAGIEPGVSSERIRSNFERLDRAGFRPVHYWRPLMAENGDETLLREVLEFVAEHALASVWLGLRLSPPLNHLYRAHLGVRSRLDNSGDYVPENVGARLRALTAQHCPDHPLYKHASCALSLALREPDFNATMHNETICRSSTCPAWKRAICEGEKTPPSEDKIRRTLRALGVVDRFTFADGAIRLEAEITQDEYCCLLHRLRFPIRAARVRYNHLLRGTNMWPQSDVREDTGGY